MKLLVFSRMFPSERNAMAGVFLARFLSLLRPRVDRIVVVSPWVYVPWLLSFRPRWAEYRAVSRRGEWHGLEVVRPAGLYVRTSMYRSVIGRLNALACRRVVRELHDRIGFDVALGWPVLQDGDALVRLARSLRIPAAIWSIGSDINLVAGQSPRLTEATRWVLENAAIVLASSRALADRARAIAPGARRIEPFYRGIDLTLYEELEDRATLRQRLGLPIDAHLLACVGRLSREKGIIEAVEAFGLLKNRHPPVHLVLVGDNVMGSELDSVIQRSGVPARVRRTGLVAHTQAAALIKAADVLLFPSHSEGLPNVPLEAMACGTVVVSTSVGGVPEFLTDGENALVVPVGDATALATAAARLLDDEELRCRLGRAGHATVRERFDASRNGTRFIEMLAETALRS